MGEFIIYYRGKIVGGIYDDRLLVKPVKSAISYMPTAPYELPYEGAKEMLLVDEVDNKEFLTGLFHAMYDELPVCRAIKLRDKMSRTYHPPLLRFRRSQSPVLQGFSAVKIVPLIFNLSAPHWLPLYHLGAIFN